MYKDAFNSVAYAIMATQDNPSAALGQNPDGLQPAGSCALWLS